MSAVTAPALRSANAAAGAESPAARESCARSVRSFVHTYGSCAIFAAHPRDLPHVPDADGRFREDGVALMLKREEEGDRTIVVRHFLAPTAQVSSLRGARLVLPLALRDERNVAHAQYRDCGASAAEEDLDCLGRDLESEYSPKERDCTWRAMRAARPPALDSLVIFVDVYGPTVAGAEDLARHPVSEVAPRAGAAEEPAAGASSRSSSPSSIISSVSCRALSDGRPQPAALRCPLPRAWRPGPLTTSGQTRAADAPTK